MKGVNAHIVMPHNSTAVKVAAVRGYGATVTFCENTKTGRESTAAAVVSEHPLSALVHPYNDYRVQCGWVTRRIVSRVLGWDGSERGRVARRRGC